MVLRPFWQKVLITGVLLSSCSCSSVSQYVQRTFSPKEAAQLARAEAPGSVSLNPSASGAKKTAPPAVAEAKSDVLNKLARGEDPFAASAGGMIEQVSAEVVTGERQTASLDSTRFSETCPPGEMAAPGMAAPGVAACPPTYGAPAVGPDLRRLPLYEYHEDESIRDGGDHGHPVHYEQNRRAGLELEDTVAEFIDDEGTFHVKASTQATIYAPRFGEVRSATLPRQDQSVVKAEGHQDRTKIAGMNAKMVLDEQTQTDEPKGMRTRDRASGLRGRVSDDQLNKAVAALNHTKLVNVYEDIRFIQEGTFDKVSAAVLQETVAAALEWADGRRPIIIAQDLHGQLVQGKFSAQEYVGIEDKRSVGNLKIVKVADKSSAHPGEIVTFTIRFDNTGGRDLKNVRLIDNLSPRLEYLEGSITSNLDGGVNTEDNGSGSLLLTFEFDQPLPGNTGGYVSFQCRVR